MVWYRELAESKIISHITRALSCRDVSEEMESGINGLIPEIKPVTNYFLLALTNNGPYLSLSDMHTKRTTHTSFFLSTRLTFVSLNNQCMDRQSGAWRFVYLKCESKCYVCGLQTTYFPLRMYKMWNKFQAPVNGAPVSPLLSAGSNSNCFYRRFNFHTDCCSKYHYLKGWLLHYPEYKDRKTEFSFCRHLPTLLNGSLTDVLCAADFYKGARNKQEKLILHLVWHHNTELGVCFNSLMSCERHQPANT